MSPVELALAAAAFVVGLTGAWSPCGFSMVETIGPTGHSGGPRTTAAACVTFALGAVIGGAFTFGALAGLGELTHGVGGRTAYVVAAAIAAVAALAEARGVPIMPQVRRQLPENWRWVMPMPVAAGLYGILLGLGFTTFVLTLGVWALAGISFAVGDPTIGLVVGVGFGVGRALPVAALAPLIEREAGIRAAELMAERPAIYRGFRFAGALTLALVAAALTTSDPARAASPVLTGGSDPSFAPGDLAFEPNRGSGAMLRNGQRIVLPGADPAIGGNWVAIRAGAGIRLLDRRTLRRVREFRTSGVNALAVSQHWLVYRVSGRRGEGLVVRPIRRVSPARRIVSVGWPAQIGRPSLEGSYLTYSLAGRGGSSIVLRRLGSGRSGALLRSRRLLLANPTLRKGRLLYVLTGARRQEARIKHVNHRGYGRLLYSIAAMSHRDRGYGPGRAPHRRKSIDLRRSVNVLWSTAMSDRFAYVTRLGFRGGQSDGVILRLRR